MSYMDLDSISILELLRCTSSKHSNYWPFPFPTLVRVVCSLRLPPYRMLIALFCMKTTFCGQCMGEKSDVTILLAQIDTVFVAATAPTDAITVTVIISVNLLHASDHFRGGKLLHLVKPVKPTQDWPAWKQMGACSISRRSTGSYGGRIQSEYMWVGHGGRLPDRCESCAAWPSMVKSATNVVSPVNNPILFGYSQLFTSQTVLPYKCFERTRGKTILFWWEITTFTARYRQGAFEAFYKTLARRRLHFLFFSTIWLTYDWSGRTCLSHQGPPYTEDGVR